MPTVGIKLLNRKFYSIAVRSLSSYKFWSSFSQLVVVSFQSANLMLMLSEMYCVPRLRYQIRYTWNHTTTIDPEIDRVDLWRSIRGKYPLTRSIDSTFGPSHDSSRLSSSAIDSIDLTDFILDSLYLPRFLADRRAY